MNSLVDFFGSVPATVARMFAAQPVLMSSALVLLGGFAMGFTWRRLR